MARILRKAKARRGSGQRVICLALLRVPWEDQQARQNQTSEQAQDVVKAREPSEEQALDMPAELAKLREQRS